MSARPGQAMARPISPRPKAMGRERRQAAPQAR